MNLSQVRDLADVYEAAIRSCGHRDVQTEALAAILAGIRVLGPHAPLSKAALNDLFDHAEEDIRPS